MPRSCATPGSGTRCASPAYYTVVVTIAIFAVAFPLALFVEKPRPLTGLYRTIFFMPAVVGFASASLLWSWLLNVDSGLFSPAAYDARPDRQEVQPAGHLPAGLLVDHRHGRLEGRRLHHDHPDDRPAVDPDRTAGGGASSTAPGRSQRFRAITLPLMRRTLALALILSVAGSILAFDQFYIILRGGPRNQTLTGGLLDLQPVLRVVQARLWRGTVDGAAGHPGGAQPRSSCGCCASRRGSTDGAGERTRQSRLGLGIAEHATGVDRLGAVPGADSLDGAVDVQAVAGGTPAAAAALADNRLLGRELRHARTPSATGCGCRRATASTSRR